MKMQLKAGVMLMILILGLSGCSTAETEPSAASVPETTEETREDAAETTEQIQEAAEETEMDTEQSESVQDEIISVPEGEVVEFAASSPENPVPVGAWASITVSDGGWPKPAYARISSVITEQEQTQELIDTYTESSGEEIIPLEEHAEFLDYIVVEYEVFFPDGFTESDNITFWGLIFSRENEGEKWIASDGSDYYWMGSLTTIEAPSSETGYPENGDTVQCKVVYPMIKDYTDYTLCYQERTEDLEETIETFFAVE